MNAYDQVRYITKPHSKSHPQLLGAEAILHGLSPAPADKCVVLEIGCGDGWNLIPMAEQFPESDFLGIDLAGEPLAVGVADAAELGIGNARFERKDLMDIDPAYGSFDYILAHGVYSWVPEAVSDRLLGVIAANLAPNGIGFVSYNTYPGCHARDLARGIMRYRIREEADPDRRVNGAREILRMIAEADLGKEEYNTAVRHEYDLVRRRSPGSVYHDDIGAHFRPLHFHEFVERAARHGLSFVCEAEYPIMREGWPLGDVDAVLNGLNLDRIERQQFLDFLLGRRFRQTLLCHAGRNPAPSPGAGQVPKLHAASCVQRVGPDRFQSRAGSRISLQDREVISALERLAESWPRTLSFDELREQTANGEPAKLAANLLMLFSFGFVELLSGPRLAASQAGARPIARKLARWQAGRGIEVTSLFHEPVTLEDEAARRMLPLLDGTRDLGQIAGLTLDQAHAIAEKMAAAGLLIA